VYFFSQKQNFIILRKIPFFVKNHLLAPPRPTPKKNLLTLVENRTSIDLEAAQLNIFETYLPASRVSLKFSDFVVTSMLRGKKVMHLPCNQPFDYLPGETVIVPGNEEMVIDFPEADEKKPTQCLALAISGERIRHLLDRLNHQFPKVATGEQWQVDPKYFHLENSQFLAEALNQLVHLSLNDSSAAKGTIADLRVEEILIRLMQTQARTYLEWEHKRLTNHPLAAVVQYIKNHLDENLDAEILSKKACMSKASFYRKFTQEMGLSPGAYVQEQRIQQAKNLLVTTSLSIAEVAYAVGFKNCAHFATFFKKKVGKTPGHYLQMSTP
jgi:AraC family transcriptional regulator